MRLSGSLRFIRTSPFLSVHSLAQTVHLVNTQLSPVLATLRIAAAAADEAALGVVKQRTALGAADAGRSAVPDHGTVQR